jgi:hypothetical protein
MTFREVGLDLPRISQIIIKVFEILIEVRPVLELDTLIREKCFRFLSGRIIVEKQVDSFILADERDSAFHKRYRIQHQGGLLFLEDVLVLEPRTRKAYRRSPQKPRA